MAPLVSAKSQSRPAAYRQAERLLDYAEQNASKAIDRDKPLVAAAGQLQALAGIGYAILDLAGAIRETAFEREDVEVRALSEKDDHAVA